MKKNILFVARDNGGCGFYRCKQPASFINRRGLADAVYVLNRPTPEQLLSADLVVMQEMGNVEASNIVDFMIKNKIPYITEFDDFVFHVSPNNLAGIQVWNPGTLYLHRSLEMTKKAFGVTVSTKWMAREFFPYNKLVFVAPNYLDKDLWDIPTTKKADDKIRIGWAGGNAHADDLKMISKVLDKIVKEYKGKVIFETMGMTAQELAGVFPMQATNEVCPSCGYEGELHHHPGENLENYPLILSQMGWDIALAPVINNAFGNAKSDLKIKEYAALGIPVVASPVDPYKEAAKSNAQVLFAETFDEWYNNIKELIENTELRSEMARKNKEWAQENWIQDNVPDIFRIYEYFIDLAERTLGPKENRLKIN